MEERGIREDKTEEHMARAKRERLVRDVEAVSLLYGVSRLNDCDSNLGKTTFVAETDR